VVDGTSDMGSMMMMMIAYVIFQGLEGCFCQKH
jgi:hypothetical protein